MLTSNQVGGDEVIQKMTLLSPFVAATTVLLSALALNACATSSYMGILLKPGAADPALQQLALHQKGIEHAPHNF